MTWKSIAAFIIAVIVAFLIALRARAQEPPLDPRILAYDKGPSKINVSSYPPEMQANYKVFTAKCGKCHTLARAINCEFVLEDEWERYVKRMMRKAGTLITPEEGKKIFEFAAYDSKIRKKDLYERRRKEAATTPGS